MGVPNVEENMLEAREGHYIAATLDSDCGYESDNSGVRTSREPADIWAVEYNQRTGRNVGIFRLVAICGDGPCADVE